MESLVKSDIFFFITGIAVIVISVVLLILLFYSIKTMKSAQRIMDRFERGTEIFADDMESIRTYFINGGLVGGISMLLNRTSTKDRNINKSINKNINNNSTKKTKSGTDIKIKDVTRS